MLLISRGNYHWHLPRNARCGERNSTFDVPKAKVSNLSGTMEYIALHGRTAYVTTHRRIYITRSSHLAHLFLQVSGIVSMCPAPGITAG
jgi:hypothetical protein